MRLRGFRDSFWSHRATVSARGNTTPLEGDCRGSLAEGVGVVIVIRSSGGGVLPRPGSRRSGIMAEYMSFPRAGWFLLLAILLDLAGFGMVIPDIQTRLESFGASGWLIGAVLASYFLAQSLMSPLWGRLSDRAGRKPILVSCGLLSALSMLVYAFANSVGLILFSRVLAGVAAANVVIAQAYLADVTDEETRPVAMGRAGAATTTGLILGPALGGWLASVGGNFLLGLVAAGVSFTGALGIALAVPRTAPMTKLETGEPLRPPKVSLVRAAPSLRFLFFLSAISLSALACLEGTFGRLIKHKFGYGPEQFGILFGYEALLGVIVQALLLPKFTAVLGPPRLLCWAFLIQGLGLAATPFMPNLSGLFLASAFYAVGAGCAMPTLNGLCSLAAPARREGEMFGLLQSVRSLGFLLGPILGGALFDWRREAPYLLAGAVLLGAGALSGSRGSSVGRATHP